MNRQEAISLSRVQVREVDRRAIEEYGIPGIVLMENAGRNAARIIESILAEKIDSEKRSSDETLAYIAIVCGRGNNGGDGFVIARHLMNFGMSVEIFLACDPGKLSGDAATNYRIVENMKVPLYPFEDTGHIEIASPKLRRATIVVDAVLGTGFTGEVRAPLDRVIAEINAVENATVIAVDVPSGLDCDTGIPANACVRADATITFVARKKGFDAPAAGDYAGQIYVADIGAPFQIVRNILAEA